MSRLLTPAVWLLLLGIAMPWPAAAAVGPPSLSTFIEVVRGHDVSTVRRSFPAYNEGLFGMVYGSGPGIEPVEPEIAALFTDQIVLTPAGRVLDIGHVITALEAAAAPTRVARLVERQTGCDMRAAVTWSGDVGKALHDHVAAGAAGDASEAFDTGAPPEDLLGDIDGWLLAQMLQPGALDVAALLEATYLSTGGFERTRFQQFVRAVGGETVLNEDARAAVEREILCFARATAALGGSGVDPQAIVTAAPPFIERFLRFIEEGLASETSATP